ncbi:hypothetical protein BKA70DRAFT_1438203 [Coprinopsis sp. MPI-PUGE-AT-0042]|nr:hypothetical protein BKA70DRAFT_1438203 [Coprinopsis sp. MPI-PUGE-AT-0042]
MNTVENPSASGLALADVNNIVIQTDPISSSEQVVSFGSVANNIDLEDVISVSDTEPSPTSTANDLDLEEDSGEEGYLVCVTCWDEMVAAAQGHRNGAAITPAVPALAPAPATGATVNDRVQDTAARGGWFKSLLMSSASECFEVLLKAFVFLCMVYFLENCKAARAFTVELALEIRKYFYDVTSISDIEELMLSPTSILSDFLEDDYEYNEEYDDDDSDEESYDGEYEAIDIGHDIVYVPRQSREMAVLLAEATRRVDIRIVVTTTVEVWHRELSSEIMVSPDQDEAGGRVTDGQSKYFLEGFVYCALLAMMSALLTYIERSLLAPRRSWRE